MIPQRAHVMPKALAVPRPLLDSEVPLLDAPLEAASADCHPTTTCMPWSFISCTHKHVAAELLLTKQEDNEQIMRPSS